MNLHFHLHFDHNHSGILARISRDLGAAYDWLAGAGMSEQAQLNRLLAEVRNDRHGNGLL